MNPRLPFKLLLACACAVPGIAALDPLDLLRPRDTQPAGAEPPAPSEAVAALKLPPGFKATLFAGDPDVRQPIDLKIDDRGRVWVCEAYSYKEWKRQGQDRILIFTDVDGDGVADERKIFRGGFNHLSSVEIGFGGVWVLDSPNLLFFPDANRDDVPDAEPEVLLDGWTTEAGHNVVSGLVWGLDGWLYGRHGITVPSLVGRPGTPESERTFIEPGVWRIHPQTRRFEMVLRGMTNPWGLDWDANGEMFLSGNVNGHLWHGIPGALFERMFGAGSVPHDYERLKMIGDHPHYLSSGDWKQDWLRADKGRDATNQLGGGHSHCGLMIYQGDNWPEAYRGQIFMCNTHGRRVNQETVEPRGSSFVGHHEGDLLISNDLWFRGVSLVYGPDGGVYISDWCDFGECHDDDGVHRSSGRIYKIMFGEAAAAANSTHAFSDLATRSDIDLAKLMTAPNEWHVRHARRLLDERAAAGAATSSDALAKLREILESDELSSSRLRAFWTLHALDHLTESDRLRFSKSPVPAHRLWSVRTLSEHAELSEIGRARLVDLARTEPSLRVRLELASALHQVPTEFRWTLARELAASPIGATPPDATLELVLWHALEPLVTTNVPAAGQLVGQTCYAKLRQFLTRRIAAEIHDPASREVFGTLLATKHPDVLAGAKTALEGRSKLPAPATWPATAATLLSSTDPLARETAIALSAAFNDSATLHLLRATLADPARPPAARIEALRALRQAAVPDLAALVRSALRETTLRLDALRTLAAVNDPGLPPLVLAQIAHFPPDEKAAALDALCARAPSARLVLEALAAGALPRADLTVSHARQIASLKDPALSDLLAKHWGDLRKSSAAREAVISKYRALLTAAPPRPPDLPNGKAVFTRLCAACHVLFGEGGKLGPDLTGSGRKELDYLLRNVLDPSAAVARDYQMTVVTLVDGQVLAGVVPTQDAQTLTIQTVAERRVLERSQIARVDPQPYSWMPEGLFESLPDSDVRDLVAYLASDG